MNVMTYLGRLIIEECCNCHCKFGMPEELYNRAREDSTVWFHCPLGHRQHYTDTEIQQLRRARDQAHRDAEFWREQELQARKDAQSAKHRERAQKAAKTRLKKRVAAGVCPCCSRTFQNLARHMANQHPEYADQE